jgi:hypothetical protein
MIQIPKNGVYNGSPESDAAKTYYANLDEYMHYHKVPSSTPEESENTPDKLGQGYQRLENEMLHFYLVKCPFPDPTPSHIHSQGGKLSTSDPEPETDLGLSPYELFNPLINTKSNWAELNRHIALDLTIYHQHRQINLVDYYYLISYSLLALFYIPYTLFIHHQSHNSHNSPPQKNFLLASISKCLTLKLLAMPFTLAHLIRLSYYGYELLICSAIGKIFLPIKKRPNFGRVLDLWRNNFAEFIGRGLRDIVRWRY